MSASARHRINRLPSQRGDVFKTIVPNRATALALIGSLVLTIIVSIALHAIYRSWVTALPFLVLVYVAIAIIAIGNNKRND